MHPERPFHRSYWAVSGKLVAGCYPGDLDPAKMDQKLKSLVHAGVTVVVNLMEENECDHAGKPFLDYLPRLRILLAHSANSGTKHVCNQLEART